MLAGGDYWVAVQRVSISIRAMPPRDGAATRRVPAPEPTGSLSKEELLAGVAAVAEEHGLDVGPLKAALDG